MPHVMALGAYDAACLAVELQLLPDAFDEMDGQKVVALLVVLLLVVLLSLPFAPGNYCRGGKEGKDAGNGRIVVAEFNNLEGDACGWDVVKVVHIPRTADFTDFSDVAFRGNKAAIVSQEDSTMWVGTFDFDKLEFVDEGQVYNFPRNSECDVIYCNVEGVKWLDDSRLVISSDKAKNDQPYRYGHLLQVS
eukprot:gene2899-3187_t